MRKKTVLQLSPVLGEDDSAPEVNSPTSRISLLRRLPSLDNDSARNSRVEIQRSKASSSYSEKESELEATVRLSSPRRSKTRLLRLAGGLKVSTAHFLKSCECELAGETALKDRLVNIARLGKGSTSNVWKAVDVETFQLVAVKEVKAEGRQARALLVRELGALQSQLSPLTQGLRASGGCKEIVTFFGSFLREEGGSVVCIAVEYVRGGSLQRWMESAQPAPEAWLAHVARQSLAALRFLHQHHRIHRDVKPANMLLSKDGGIKLADFGIAVQAGEDGSGSAMAGTRRYMSPERLRAERYGYNSDVWSLGLSIAAVALGGCPIPEGENEFDQLEYSEDAPALVRARGAAASLSPALLDFLQACLAVDPAERQSAAELCQHPFLTAAHGTWGEDAAAHSAVVRALQRRTSCAKLRDGGGAAAAAAVAFGSDSSGGGRRGSNGGGCDSSGGGGLDAIAAADAAAEAFRNSGSGGGSGRVSTRIRGSAGSRGSFGPDAREKDEAFYARRVVEEILAARRERFGSGYGRVDSLDVSDLAFELNASEDGLRELFAKTQWHMNQRELQRRERRSASRSASRTPSGSTASSGGMSGGAAAGGGHGGRGSLTPPSTARRRGSSSGSLGGGIDDCLMLSPGAATMSSVFNSGSGMSPVISDAVPAAAAAATTAAAASTAAAVAVGAASVAADADATPRGDAAVYSSDDEVRDGAVTGRALYARSSPPRARRRASDPRRSSGSPSGSGRGRRRKSGSENGSGGGSGGGGGGGGGIGGTDGGARGGTHVSASSRDGGGGGGLAEAGEASCTDATFTDGEEAEVSYFSEAARSPSPRGAAEFTFGGAKGGGVVGGGEGDGDGANRRGSNVSGGLPSCGSHGSGGGSGCDYGAKAGTPRPSEDTEDDDEGAGRITAKSLRRLAPPPPLPLPLQSPAAGGSRGQALGGSGGHGGSGKWGTGDGTPMPPFLRPMNAALERGSRGANPPSQVRGPPANRPVLPPLNISASRA